MQQPELPVDVRPSLTSQLPMISTPQFFNDIFYVGEKVQLLDKRHKKVTIQLVPQGKTQTEHGYIWHDDLIGRPCGVKVVTSSHQDFAKTGRQLSGWEYIAQRPRLADYVLSMPRGAQIMYPKDIAQLIMQADIHPGLVVVESGGGSGAMSLGILNALGSIKNNSQLITIEKRSEFARISQANIEIYYQGSPQWWSCLIGEFVQEAQKIKDHTVDRVIFDLLDPWNQLDQAARILRPGGVVGIYITTTTQMNRVTTHLYRSQQWSDIEIVELIERHWKAEGLSVRPEHSMIGHTGFLITARRLESNTSSLQLRKRGSKDVWKDVDSGMYYTDDPTSDLMSDPVDDAGSLSGSEGRAISDKKIRKVLRDLEQQTEVIRKYHDNNLLS